MNNIEQFCKNPIGYWGRLRKKYLYEENINLYYKLISEGILWEHLEQINKQANERYNVIINELKKSVNEKDWLIESVQGLYVGYIHNIAKDIVYSELIAI